MEKYDYRKNICDDIKSYIKDNNIDVSNYDGSDWQILSDKMFVRDDVTGNASGSYTFNRWDAEENICHNLDLLKEACEEFCYESDIYNPEACDVAIRCYLLNECLSIVREEFENNKDDEDKNNSKN